MFSGQAGEIHDKKSHQLISKLAWLFLLGSISIPLTAGANDKTKELAKASQNPLAKLITLPFENNINMNAGVDNKIMNVLLVKPVVPISLGDDWNMINRAIVPIVSLPGTSGGQSRTDGLGDTTYQAFFSPSKPINGWILGAGPQFQLPTHTDDVLGNDRWGAGPAAVALTMPGNWVTGMLVQQLWSFTKSSESVCNSAFRKLQLRWRLVCGFCAGYLG